MKNSNSFDLKRFFRLLQQDLMFNYTFYLIFLTGLSLGIYLVSLVFIRYSGGYILGGLNRQAFNSFSEYVVLKNSTIPSYFAIYNFVFAAVIVFVGMSFPSFRKKEITFLYILTPGSALEKLLVQFVIRFVLFIPLVLIILSIGFNLALASLAPYPEAGMDPLFIDKLDYKLLFFSSGGLINNPIRDLSYLFASFAGAVYFRRYAVIKTQVVLTLFSILVLVSFSLTHGKNWFTIGKEFQNGVNYYFGISPITIGFLLLSLPWTYCKLQEREL